MRPLCVMSNSVFNDDDVEFACRAFGHSIRLVGQSGRTGERLRVLRTVCVFLCLVDKMELLPRCS